MNTVAQILGERTGAIIKVGPAESVLHALDVMAQHGVGAVLVMEYGRLLGILSERDYARKVALKGKISETTRVRDIMSTRVICATPQMTLDQAMALMGDNNIRHLPVIDDAKEVVGVISIRDLVKEIIVGQRFVIEQLERYIAA